LNQIQALAPDKMADFYNFQRHRRNGLPKVLQGETLTPPDTQQMKAQGLEMVSSSRQETLESLEKTEVLTQKGDTTTTNVAGDQDKDQTKTLT
jgi:hypothetical protein